MAEEKEWSTGVMDHCGSGCLEAIFCCVGYSKANEIAEKLELEPQCGIPWGCCYACNPNRTVATLRMVARERYTIEGNCINDALVAACCTGCALGQIIAQIEEEGGGGAPDGVGVDSGVMDMTR